jgi:nitronate monooxygenase
MDDDRLTMEQDAAAAYRTSAACRLCEGITLRVPVVQAALGACDGPLLAAEVSRAGALGCLTVHQTNPEALRRRLARVRRRTTRPVLLAFTAPFESDAVLDTALEMGFPHVQVFWWNGPRISARVHAAGGVVFWQVNTTEQAADALQCGADVLIAQGTEAGGQVRGPHPLPELIASLRALAHETPFPLVAGGGLADRRDVEQVLSWGASAAMLGTRFLMSHEAQSPPSFKARLARADANDLWLDPRVLGDWPCAPRRRLRREHDLDTPALYAGLGVGKMRRILPAADIVRSLVPFGV